MGVRLAKYKGQPLYKILRNNDEKGFVLTYSVFRHLGNDKDTIYEFEENTRKKAKIWTFKD